LEAVLENAVQLDKPVVLIVDGIDHIARVLSEARFISSAETDIVDQLATLRIPSGVALIVGSQPGAHLAPLREAIGDQIMQREVLPWGASEISELSRRLGVEIALKKAANRDPDVVLLFLAERSEGNPLYATYLSRELKAGLELGTIADVEEWLSGVPVIRGDIARYYTYLYRHASKMTQDIADVLGVIDFGVSVADLREIVHSPRQDWVPEALKHLSPILTAISSQGGVRIFHESFRRFIMNKLTQQGRSVTNALEPVIAWL